MTTPRKASSLRRRRKQDSIELTHPSGSSITIGFDKDGGPSIVLRSPFGAEVFMGVEHIEDERARPVVGVAADVHDLGADVRSHAAIAIDEEGTPQVAVVFDGRLAGELVAHAWRDGRPALTLHDPLLNTEESVRADLEVNGEGAAQLSFHDPLGRPRMLAGVGITEDPPKSGRTTTDAGFKVLDSDGDEMLFFTGNGDGSITFPDFDRLAQSGQRGNPNEQPSDEEPRTWPT
jgi:hypothetical protein